MADRFSPDNRKCKSIMSLVVPVLTPPYPKLLPRSCAQSCSEIPKRKHSQKRSERRNLSVLYANAQCIMNKLCDLEVLAGEQSPDIIAVTESWINSDIPDASVSLNGYT